MVEGREQGHYQWEREVHLIGLITLGNKFRGVSEAGLHTLLDKVRMDAIHREIVHLTNQDQSR